MVFPLIKLIYLATKQVSKPVANIVKARVKQWPRFKFICLKPAQWYHWADVNIRMRILGLGKAEKVEPLSEAAAIDLGADMVGELVVYGIGVGILFAESARSSAKEELKEEMRKNEVLELEQKVMNLEIITEQQETRLRELSRRIYDVNDKNQSLTSRIFGSGKRVETDPS